MAQSTASDLVKFYTNTFIDQSELEVPFKLLKIDENRFAVLEAVALQIQALNNINNLTGVNLDALAFKWNTPRAGANDDTLRDNIIKRMHIYFSGSTIKDFNAVLLAFGAPVGSTITERLPPEDAEVEVFLNGADPTTFDNISTLLDEIRGAAIGLDITNAVPTSRLKLENGNFLVQEDGNFILLEFDDPVFMVSEDGIDTFITEDGIDTFIEEDG